MASSKQYRKGLSAGRREAREADRSGMFSVAAGVVAGFWFWTSYLRNQARTEVPFLTRALGRTLRMGAVIAGGALALDLLGVVNVPILSDRRRAAGPMGVNVSKFLTGALGSIVILEFAEDAVVGVPATAGMNPFAGLIPAAPAAPSIPPGRTIPRSGTERIENTEPERPIQGRDAEAILEEIERRIDEGEQLPTVN